MTIEEKRNKMISEGRIILSPLDFAAHYGIVLMLGLGNVLIVILAWNQKPPNPSIATMTNNDIIIWTIIDLLLMAFFFLVQREKLKIVMQSIDLEKDQVLEVIQNVGVGLGWFVKSFDNSFIQADLIYLFAGNRISIFIKENEVYLNSRTKYGEFTGVSRQNKITETFLNALIMKDYEMKHQKKKIENLNLTSKI